jgi:hypothetical protein
MNEFSKNRMKEKRIEFIARLATSRERIATLVGFSISYEQIIYDKFLSVDLLFMLSAVLLLTMPCVMERNIEVIILALKSVADMISSKKHCAFMNESCTLDELLASLLVLKKYYIGVWRDEGRALTNLF